MRVRGVRARLGEGGDQRLVEPDRDQRGQRGPAGRGEAAVAAGAVEEQGGEHQAGEHHQAVGRVAADGTVQPAGVPGEVVDLGQQPVVESAQGHHVVEAPRQRFYYVRM